MQKALTRINVQIQQAIGDITGVTGAIVDAIPDVQRYPALLVTSTSSELRDPKRILSGVRWDGRELTA